MTATVLMGYYYVNEFLSWWSSETKQRFSYKCTNKYAFIQS